MTYRVLVVQAQPLDDENARDQLRLGAEAHVIASCLKGADKRVYEAVFCHAATLATLRAALLREKPDVLHFAGHGSADGLLFEDADGKERKVTPGELANLLKHCRKRVHAIILNACDTIANSPELAKAGMRNIVSMNDAIDDDGAIEFCRAFYDSVASGDDIDVAYGHGCTAYVEAVPGATEAPAVHRAVRKARTCRNCGSAILRRLGKCQFCEGTPVDWPAALKALAMAVGIFVAGSLAYLQWVAQPWLEFEKDDGKLLHFTLVNSTLDSVSLVKLTVDDSVLLPEVKIGSLTAQVPPVVRSLGKAAFTVDVNHVRWETKRAYEQSETYLSPRLEKAVVFKATLMQNGETLTVDERVPVGLMKAFLTSGHGTPRLK
jgi:CHAT domain